MRPNRMGHVLTHSTQNMRGPRGPYVADEHFLMLLREHGDNNYCLAIHTAQHFLPMDPSVTSSFVKLLWVFIV